MKCLRTQSGEPASKRSIRKEPATEGPAQAKATMADFWIKHGWYKPMKDGSKKLTYADWRQGMGIREEAIRFLVEKVLKKAPRDISEKDFYSNRLTGLLGHYYNGSPYTALKEAGYSLHPWEMSWTPMGFFKLKEDRVAAIHWLVDKLKKDPRDVTYDNFLSNRLGGLLALHYNNSPYNALKEAGYNFHPWEMLKAPQGFYELKKNRVAAIRWLVDKLEKDPRNIIVEDFDSNRLDGLIEHYKGSPYKALLEAGLVTEVAEARMRKHGPK